MFPFYLTIPSLHTFSCSRLVYCCSHIVHLLGLIILKLHQWLISASVTFACIVSSELARWLWAAVTVGVSAHGVRVRVTSQCESPNENNLKKDSCVLELCALRFVLLLSRWRCPRLTGCSHSWKRWAAPAATSCPTPQLQSALLAWLTRDHRVSLCCHPRLCPVYYLFIFFLPSIRSSVMVYFLQVILWTNWFKAQWQECAVN